MQNACISIYRKEPWRFFKIPFVRPENLEEYDFVDEFKLSTRTLKTEVIVEIMKAYIGRSFDGNLVELLDTHGMKLIVRSVENKKIPPDFTDKDDHYYQKLFQDIGKLHTIPLKGEYYR
jgi:hypothetical protein